MRLAVIHRARTAGALPLAGAVWTTCLRDVAFVAEDEGHAGAGDLVVTGADAYALILEIVCGLRSPLLGETEVQAQFKSFLATLDPTTHGWLQRLGQRVLGDAKAIRHDYLQGLGVGSYGQLALQHAAGSRLVIVGAGALAQDILDHCPSARAVDVWRRREADDLRVGEGQCRRFLIADAEAIAHTTDAASIVVAAPVETHDLERIARCYPQLVDVVDLRATDDGPSLARRVRQIGLTEILSEVASGPLRPVASAREAIQERAHGFATRRELRPFGWDDLYA